MTPGPRCLGRTPSRRDPRTLRLATYVAPDKLPPPPPARDWTIGRDGRPTAFGMFANDRVGDCAIAASMNMAIAMRGAAVDWGTPAPTEADAIAAYRRISGYTPTDPTTDQGCQMIDVLRAWRADGIAGDRCAAYVQLSPANDLHVRLAVNAFGGAYVGAQLPRAAMTQTVWDVGTGDTYARNSWGAHAMALAGYDRTHVKLVTWGAVQLATWAWFLDYVDEAWAVLDPGDLAAQPFARGWTSPQLWTPGGFDINALRQHVAELAA